VGGFYHKPPRVNRNLSFGRDLSLEAAKCACCEPNFVSLDLLPARGVREAGTPKNVRSFEGSGVRVCQRHGRRFGISGQRRSGVWGFRSSGSVGKGVRGPALRPAFRGVEVYGCATVRSFRRVGNGNRPGDVGAGGQSMARPDGGIPLSKLVLGRHLCDGWNGGDDEEVNPEGWDRRQRYGSLLL
jgi:hypothetical protein